MQNKNVTDTWVMPFYGGSIILPIVIYTEPNVWLNSDPLETLALLAEFGRADLFCKNTAKEILS